MGDPVRLTFGLVPPPSFVGFVPLLTALMILIGERAGITLVRRHVGSYDELVRSLRSGTIDVAWLPPIPFARLEGEAVVRALVCAERGGSEAYVAVLFTRADSAVFALSDVRGKRVGWVDPLSTTGYVIPRMRLSVRFPEGSEIFGKETFYGSHAAVIRAVLDGVVDVGASYGGFSQRGELVRGAFSDFGAHAADLRVVDAFGAIPSDVIAIHSKVGAEVEALLAAAFEATSAEPAMLDAIRTTFGAMAFVRKPVVGYDLLRTEIEHGVDSGVIPAAAAFLSTKPPPGAF
jgi:phosphate/phosphite/phosphonate ABC transporter binding protein